MKKRLLFTVILVLSIVLFTGCGNEDTASGNNKLQKNEGVEEIKDQEDTDLAIDSEEADTENDATENAAMENDATEAEQNRTVSISEEMAEIERKSLEYENGNWDLPQQEMNAKSWEWYTLWDDELNALWNQLSIALSEAEMDELVKEQTAWISRKEKNMIAAGFEAYGGTLQPLLESSIAEEMTRARTYILAEYLAKAIGESYTIPDDIKESFADVDTSLDSVYESFRGNYTLDENIELHINTLEESTFSPDAFTEGTKWVLWYSNSDVLTENDVYAFTKNRIIFEKEGVYYVLEKGWEGNTILLLSGTDLLYMDLVGSVEG